MVTNYERIRSMTPEEMTKFLVEFQMDCYKVVGAILLPQAEYEKTISGFLSDEYEQLLKDATFTSVWDEGSRDCQEITTACKVNMETKEVFDIETVDCFGVDVLDREYVTIDGTQYSVSRKEDGEDTEYWYK